MAKNTTPVAPNAKGKQAHAKKGPDVRKPLVTDMASAKEHGYCSPSKGKTHS